MAKELVTSDEVNYASFEYHEAQENIVDILVNKTGREDRGYFRILVAYKFAEIASHMRTNVNYLGSSLPVNIYAINLAGSGYSKGLSMNILDDTIFNGFRKEFEDKTFKSVSELNLQSIADMIVVDTGIDQLIADGKVDSEFNKLPKFLYSFGSSTPEGFKALRLKLSMAAIGATSFVIDEIGSAMVSNADALATHLDAYDKGKTKQKLIKLDSNNELYGPVPANLFMFGTQAKLFDGGSTEDMFFDLLEEGYGRRLIMGYVENHKSSSSELTSDELYDIAMDTTTDLLIKSISASYKGLSDVSKYNTNLSVDREVAKIFIQYKKDCEELGSSMRSHETIKRAIVEHGYWRAIKLAGAYAFIDETAHITEEHAKAAIALIEDSNKSFDKIAKRPTAYVKLIEYMADVEKEITQVELIENLPFYKGSESQKKELMTLAIAHGYRNKIVVKRTYSDGVEFFKADRLVETDLEHIKISWSKDITTGYLEHVGPWNELSQLTCANGYHYTASTWKDGHRNSDNLIKGFNLCILDIDKGISLSVAKSLLSEFTFMMYETKRSTPAHNRFRILIPLSHTLNLNTDDFKEFMKNVNSFMPFETDEQTTDVARKWMSNGSTPHYNKGNMLDVYNFLPKTKKQEEMQEISSKISNADSVQRFFLLNHSSGRNTACMKYALMLMDNGESADNAMLLVRDFNSKLVDPLQDTELASTVFKTIYKAEAKREIQNN